MGRRTTYGIAFRFYSLITGGDSLPQACLLAVDEVRTSRDITAGAVFAGLAVLEIAIRRSGGQLLFTPRS